MAEVQVRPSSAAQSLPERVFGTLRRYWFVYLLMLPGLAWIVVFQYVPIYGLLVAFKDFNIVKGITRSPWVGLENFRVLFQSARFYLALRNTLIINLYSLAFGFTFTVFLALLLNEVRISWYKRTVQTMVYIPHFVSWVVIGALVSRMLYPEPDSAATSNYDNGIVPFAETGSWFEAYQNLRDVRTERVNAALAVPDGVECSAPFTAIWQGGGCAACTGPNPPAWCQFQAGNELWHSFLAEGWEGWPQYVDLVALSEEETQIQVALTDIKNKWWVAFVLGNKDVEADWDSFVAEYNEAGGKMLFDAWNVKVADAKATWDSVQ